MANTEQLLEKRFHQACKKHGVKTIKVDPENVNGFPDRIVFNSLVGEIHYVELKNNTHYERTHNQKVWASIIEKCNGTYFLLDGDKDVDEYLEKHIHKAEPENNEEEFLKKLIDLTYLHGVNSKQLIRNMAKDRIEKRVKKND